MNFAIRVKSPFWIIVILLLMNIPHAGADDKFIDYHGFTVFYGHSDWTNIGPDPIDDYEWTTVSYLLGKDLSSWFAFETQFGVGYLKTDNFGDSLSLEARILANLHYKFLFLKIGGGAAHLFDDDNLPGLAESNIQGIITGSAGLRFLFDRKGKPPVELTLGYGVEHMSAPTKGGEDGDEGWNTGGTRLTLAWTF